MEGGTLTVMKLEIVTQIELAIKIFALESRSYSQDKLRPSENFVIKYLVLKYLLLDLKPNAKFFHFDKLPKQNDGPQMDNKKYFIWDEHLTKSKE